MMPHQPRRVTPAEIADLLAEARNLKPDSSSSERIAYFERKASLLSAIAQDLDTAEAHTVAADAWAYLSRLSSEADAADTEDAGR
jgi:hypothetical protein